MVRHFLIRTAVIACIIAYPLSCTAGEDIWIEYQRALLVVQSWHHSGVLLVLIYSDLESYHQYEFHTEQDSEETPRAIQP